MAKAAHGEKSSAVRSELEANPQAKPREIVATLKGKGISISPQMVSTIKSNYLKDARKSGRKLGKLTHGTITLSKRGGSNLSIADLEIARELVQRVGGINAAKDALETLTRLSV